MLYKSKVKIILYIGDNSYIINEGMFIRAAKTVCIYKGSIYRITDLDENRIEKMEKNKLITKIL